MATRPTPGALSARAVTFLLCMGLTATAHADRVYLGQADIEAALIGKAVVSKNLSTGMLSHWEFRPDGSVRVVNWSGPGRASGTWVVRSDGLTCVTVMARTGCRYWWRQGDSLANAESNRPDAPTVAEVRFD